MTTLFVVAVELYKIFVRSKPWFENLGREKEPAPLEASNDASDVDSGNNEGKREKISEV